MISLLGSMGNRYLILIEGHDSLFVETLCLFYEKYLGTSDTDSYVRTEDMPNDKQAVIKKLIKILGTAVPQKKVFSKVYVSREIKKIDLNAYTRLIKRGVIIESDK